MSCNQPHELECDDDTHITRQRIRDVAIRNDGVGHVYLQRTVFLLMLRPAVFNLLRHIEFLRHAYMCLAHERHTPYQESSWKQVAALSISSLLGRCCTTLATYIADESLRGNLPLPRYVVVY